MNKLRSIICLLIIIFLNNTLAKSLNPIVLFHGAGGSQLEIKTDHKLPCLTVSRNYTLLWLNIAYLNPIFFDCFKEMVKLAPRKGSRFVPQKGVHVRPINFGSTYSIEILEPVLRKIYMKRLVDQLVKIGYKRDYSIKAAQYDFRLGIDQEKDYNQKTKQLIEQIYAINGNQKVILLAHSQGCLRSVNFLNHQTLDWKKKYIKKLIALAGPWSGSMDSLQALAEGFTLGIPFIDRSKFREMERTFSGLMELTPIKETFKDFPLIRTLKKNYTSNNYHELYTFLECPECLINYKHLVLPNITFPEVDLVCIHGSGIKTSLALNYGNYSSSEKPEIITGDGDGLVNLVSLEYCKLWSKHGSQFKYVHMPGVEHNQLIKDKKIVPQVLKYL